MGAAESESNPHTGDSHYWNNYDNINYYNIFTEIVHADEHAAGSLRCVAN